MTVNHNEDDDGAVPCIRSATPLAYRRPGSKGAEPCGELLKNRFVDANPPWEDHFYPEIIDPVTGEPVPDGQEGELVFTSLTKEALPIIRYRTRDLTRLLPGTARTMRRMQKITGRSDDMMIIRGVNVFPSQIEELILRQPALAPHYVCEIDKVGPLDTLTVKVEGKPGLEATRGQAERAQLEQAIKTLIGVSCRVSIESEGAIERSVGKAKRVIDRRPK